jgi:hypothetical protein
MEDNDKATVKEKKKEFEVPVRWVWWQTTVILALRKTGRRIWISR